MARGTQVGTFAVVALLAGCDSDRTSNAVEHFAMESPRPLPFSAAVRVGDLLFLSGQLGTDSSTISFRAASGRRPGRPWRTSVTCSPAPGRPWMTS